MKLFSNFDTNLCDAQYSETCEQYWDDKVLFIRRDKLYLYLRVYRPLLWSSLLCLVIMLLLYINTWGMVVVIWWIVVVSIILLMWYLSFGKWVDRWMDYTIINPRQVIQYDQTGLLSRSTRTLDMAKIKSINIKKHGLMTSIFNLWDIVFFSEWDESHGDIRLNYIKEPIKLKQAITKIMHDAISARQSAAQESGYQQQ